MRRPFVQIYQDKKYNAHIYFDYKEHEFFTNPEKKNSSIVYLSGFVGIIFYLFLKNVAFDIGLNPFTLVLLSVLVGVIIGFASLKLMMNSINKNLDEKKIVVTPTKEQLKEYIYEGKKQNKTMNFTIVFLLFLSLFSASFLFIMPESLLMFLLNIIFWAVFIIATWGIQPIKRRQVINQLIKEL